jgi:hypothetical protein
MKKIIAISVHRFRFRAPFPRFFKAKISRNGAAK